MKLILIVLQTLNGVISKGSEDDLSWGSAEDKTFFRTKTREIGTMIMGSSTFEAMPPKAFSDRFSLVLTSNPEKHKDYKNEFGTVDFFSGTPAEAVEYLNKKGIEQAALIGGGKINNSFLKAGLVDELFVTIAPKLIIGGVAGFGTQNLELDMSLLNTQKLNTHEILLHYQVNKN